MTRDEQKEFDYRITERLGIMCEDREPTPEQLEIARTEANHWLAESRGELFAELP